MDSTTGGPIVRLGTKWPSITSRCRMAAPPRSTRAISSASRAKFADRTEGTISIIWKLFRFYHSGLETIAGLTAWKAQHGLHDEPWRNRSNHGLVFFGLERAGGVDQQTPACERGACAGEQRQLAGLQVGEIGGDKAPFDFRIAPESSGAGTR